MNDFILGDCMEYLRKMPDDAFDLAIVDPPYGDGLHAEDGGGKGWFTKYNQRLIGEDDPEHRNLRGRFDKYNRFGGMFQKSVDAQTTRPNGVPKHDSADPNQIEIPGVTAYSRYGGVGSRFEKYKRTPEEWGLSATSSQTTDKGRTEQAESGIKSAGKKIIAWDVAPGEEYFNELFRVSRNQIIWGGNYFDLPPTRCFVVWRKTNIPLKGFSMSPVEYAWTSFRQNAVCIEANAQGTTKEPRFHPTQKPVGLYEELLMRFAKQGDKILDTHVGSGSSLIACYNLGYDYTGFEIDELYYKKASERIADVMAQIRLDI